MKKDFNDFRFAGLNYRDKSNKYFTMDRVSADETKIVVKVGDAHLIPTKYGFALVLDKSHVVFLKQWQVSQNYYGNEVLLQKDFFIVKEWGDFDDFEDAIFEGNEEILTWEHWLEAAKAQDALVDEDGMKLNRVSWEK